MDMASLWGSTIANQGFMFWSATGVVALGITIILISGFVHIRRLRSRFGRPVLPATVALSEPVVIAADISLDQEMNKEAQKYSVESVSRSTEPNSQQLRILLARLRTAADQLEDFRDSNRPVSAKSPDSSLKELAEGVDYLFRTGTG